MGTQKPKIKFKGKLIGRFTKTESKDIVQSSPDCAQPSSIEDTSYEEEKVITLWAGNELHIFTHHTIEEVQEWLLDEALVQLKQIYLPNAYQWIEANRPDLEIELQELEERINSFTLSQTSFNELKSLLQSYWRWHVEALKLYKEHIQQHVEKNEHKSFFLETHLGGKGGEVNMGITIEAEKPIDPGVYEATIAKIDTSDGKFGKRLQVTFELQDGRSVSSFFPPKATANNKTGRLFEKALGKLETVDSDELIGKTVKVLIEHNEHNGRTYTNVSKIL